ncbi:MAG: HPr family phosphocarrier protein [Lachnospiraceae bacterium]|nr:HPr family phosphocarrier protein [Lachnospiraceae bacterium]
MKEERDIVVKLNRGIHAITAAKIYIILKEAKSVLSIKGPDFETDGKDVIGLLAMNAHKDSVLHVTAEGEDAKEIVDKLEEFVSQEIDL